MEKLKRRRHSNLTKAISCLLIALTFGILGYLIGSGYVTIEW